MKIDFDKIEDAFLFVSMEQMYIHQAFLCKETGEVFYKSELGGFDELPDDIDDLEKYIAIPHKNDLDLGTNLVFQFVSEFIPERMDKVKEIFTRKGAYARFKDLLEYVGMLEKWYEYENQAQSEVLKKWCYENNLENKLPPT